MYPRIEASAEAANQDQVARVQSGCLLLPSGAGRAAAVVRRTSWNAVLVSSFLQATCAEWAEWELSDRPPHALSESGQI